MECYYHETIALSLLGAWFLFAAIMLFEGVIREWLEKVLKRI